MPRLQSHVWVSAFLRREAAEGAYAAISRKGAAEAGAIFVVHDHLDGSLSVYGPAPQADLSDDETAAGRRFELVHDRASPIAARDWLDRQIRFDSDCWIVETERRNGKPALI